MTMYYLEFKTWAEGRIETPWPFVWFEEDDDYRLRTNLSIRATEAQKKAAFMDFNAESAERFLGEYIPAAVLGALIDAHDEDDARIKASLCFGVIETIGICKADGEHRERIELLMKNAGGEPPPASNVRS